MKTIEKIKNNSVTTGIIIGSISSYIVGLFLYSYFGKLTIVIIIPVIYAIIKLKLDNKIINANKEEHYTSNPFLEYESIFTKIRKIFK